MKNLIFLLFFQVAIPLIYAQNKELKIQDIHSKKTYVLKPNKTLRLQTKTEIIKGRFQIVSDTTILISGSTVALNEIISLKANPKKKITSGVLLLSAGSGLLIGGIIDRSLTTTSAAYGAFFSIITNTPSYYVAPDYTTSNVLIGSGVATMSLAVGILCHKHVFDMKNNKIEVVVITH